MRIVAETGMPRTKNVLKNTTYVRIVDMLEIFYLQYVLCGVIIYAWNIVCHFLSQPAYCINSGCWANHPQARPNNGGSDERYLSDKIGTV